MVHFAILINVSNKNHESFSFNLSMLLKNSKNRRLQIASLYKDLYFHIFRLKHSDTLKVDGQRRVQPSYYNF